MNINHVAVSGNLTRDPELKSTASGLSVLSFSVAVNDRIKNREGEWEDYANFIDCVSFGKQAEGLAKVLAKGTKVAICGKLHFSKWEDNGKTRSKLEVYPSNVDVISRSKRDETAADSNYTPAEETAPQNGSQSFYDDEIPF